LVSGQFPIAFTSSSSFALHSSPNTPYLSENDLLPQSCRLERFVGDTSSWQFYCSSVVIGTNAVLTASHCIMDHYIIPLPNSSIRVVCANGEIRGVKSRVAPKDAKTSYDDNFDDTGKPKYALSQYLYSRDVPKSDVGVFELDGALTQDLIALSTYENFETYLDEPLDAKVLIPCCVDNYGIDDSGAVGVHHGLKLKEI